MHGDVLEARKKRDDLAVLAPYPRGEGPFEGTRGETSSGLDEVRMNGTGTLGAAGGREEEHEPSGLHGARELLDEGRGPRVGEKIQKVPEKSRLEIPLRQMVEVRGRSRETMVPVRIHVHAKALSREEDDVPSGSRAYVVEARLETSLEPGQELGETGARRSGREDWVGDLHTAAPSRDEAHG